MIATHKDLARKLEALEKRYDAQFKVVFDAIREPMARPEANKPAPARSIFKPAGVIECYCHLTRQRADCVELPSTVSCNYASDPGLLWALG